jgi:hypothetical protein
MDIFDWIACAALVFSIGNTIAIALTRYCIHFLLRLIREITSILIERDIV